MPLEQALNKIYLKLNHHIISSLFPSNLLIKFLMVSMSSEPATFTKILAVSSLEKQVDFCNKTPEQSHF